MATTVRRRVAAGALAWLGGLGAAAAVAHPESCSPPTAGAALEAATDAVRWIAVNQAPDGEFLYRYDRDAAAVVPGYNTVRHAGTLLALEQARAHAIPGAADAAARGIGWAKRRLTELPGDRVALTGQTGATALLVAALVERRRVDGSTGDDPLLRRLGRFLAGAVTAEGAVVASWVLDADEPVPGSRSPFFTGEVLWALARLHAELPTEGWDEPVRRISRYVAVDRDDAERVFPPVSDHWASYAFAEISAWPHGTGTASPELTGAERSYLRRQAGLFGVQIRFESQRRDAGPARLTRGPTALTAGIGTVGEGLGGIWRTAATDDRLEIDRGAVADRLACVAGMLVERQADDDDPRLDGAWFRQGVTQVDDQQHAISALLAATAVLEVPS
jgi:hypothetical protein